MFIEDELLIEIKENLKNIFKIIDNIDLEIDKIHKLIKTEEKRLEEYYEEKEKMFKEIILTVLKEYFKEKYTIIK